MRTDLGHRSLRALRGKPAGQLAYARGDHRTPGRIGSADIGDGGIERVVGTGLFEDPDNPASMIELRFGLIRGASPLGLPYWLASAFAESSGETSP
jgi:hypothetical protein